MAKRKIIRIDEERCNGCGACIPNCPEGALQIIDGKARLVSDLACDGLGACIGYCPQGAIAIEEREAKAYAEKKPLPCGCPGTAVKDFRKKEDKLNKADKQTDIRSQLRQWPVQIMLVPTTASYLKDTDLLIAADCVPFAYANFHQHILKGRVLLVGCPKLDDADFYKEKIAHMLKENSISSVTCAHMEVPCCFGMVEIAKQAIKESGKNIPFSEITIGIEGNVLK